MERSIHKRTALVTGGGRGLGKAIAVELAKSGADVILLGRDEKTLSETKIEIQGLGVRAFAFGVDVTDAKKVKEVFSEIAKEPGNLDIVVNNVGGAEPFGGFENLKDEDWQSAFEINFLCAVWVSREALPLLRKSKAARLINISSVPAHQPGFFRSEDWQSAFEINFLCAVWVSREALPLLRKSKAARLINISSVPAHQPGFF